MHVHSTGSTVIPAPAARELREAAAAAGVELSGLDELVVPGGAPVVARVVVAAELVRRIGVLLGDEPAPPAEVLIADAAPGVCQGDRLVADPCGRRAWNPPPVILAVEHYGHWRALRLSARDGEDDYPYFVDVDAPLILARRLDGAGPGALIGGGADELARAELVEHSTLCTGCPHCTHYGHHVCQHCRDVAGDVALGVEPGKLGEFGDAAVVAELVDELIDDELDATVAAALAGEVDR